MNAVESDRDLPQVLGSEEKGDWRVIRLRIPADLYWFDGHFSGMPLLPGVVQTHWAVQFARDYFPLSGQFQSLNNIKFMRFIMPNACIDLHLRFVEERGELSFEYREGDAPCASGRIRFA